MVRAGELTIDIAERTARVGEHRLELPAKEYELLRTLATEPTRVFTRLELLRIVWGQAFGTSRTSTATPTDYAGGWSRPARAGC